MSKLNNTLSDHASLWFDPCDLESPTVEDGAGDGGGGGAPDWLPAGAVAFADFANGHYYAGGAVTTLTDMWVSNLEYGGDAFDPAGVSGAGLTNAAGPATAADWFDLTDGATIVLEGIVDNSSIGGDLWSTGFATDAFFVGAVDAVLAFATNGSVATGANSPGPIKIAFTGRADGTASVSWNGGSVETSVGDAGTFGLLTVFAGGLSTASSVTVYPPQADADLPALSV